MKKVLKWTGIALGSLIVLAAVAAVGLAVKGDRDLVKSFDIQPAAVDIPTDSASIANGQRLVMIHCSTCHGTDLAGTEFFNDPSLGTFPAPNLTSGKGGRTAGYTATDWVRSIRHGVKPNGVGAVIMPSKVFQHLSDKDLGQMVAYLQKVPPVDKKWPQAHFTFMARVLLGAGAFGNLVDASIVDHEKARNIVSPEPAPTENYGAYLVNVGGCNICHGKQLNGGQDPDPSAPFAPNLTPTGNPGKWTADEFIATMRTGNTPEKKALNHKYMPWPGFARMTDEELTAIYKYLRSKPGVATAGM